MPPLTIGLVRVSTAHQDPLSQRHAIEAWSAAAARPIDGWADEGHVSGALSESRRPRLATLLAWVDVGAIGTIVITEWSRLGRDVLAQLQRALYLRRKGVTVVVLDDARVYDLDDPDDLLIFFLLVWADAKARIDSKKRTARSLDGWMLDGKPVLKGTPGAVRVSVRNGKRIRRPPYIWTPEKDAELMRLAEVEGLSGRSIYERGFMLEIDRGRDEDGQPCEKSGKRAVSFVRELAQPGKTVIEDRLRLLRARAAS